MPHPLAARLQGITEILMAHHAASAQMPSASKGSDREVLVREFFSQVFPPQYRFGSGAVVDAQGGISGQMDVVIEFPFLPSFPAPGARDRLYLAESVAVALEVKSSLHSQWPKIQASAGKLLGLRRNWRAHAAHSSKGATQSFDATVSWIPFVVVAYKGPKSGIALSQRLQSIPVSERPTAVFVVESGAYSGCSLCESTVCTAGAAGMLAFANDLAWLVRNVTWAAPRIGAYLDVLDGSAEA